MLRHRHKLAAVLLCVVVLRGWWRGLHKRPRLSSAHAEIAEGNDSDWPNGGDVDVRLRPEEGDFDVDPTVAMHKDTVKGSDAELKKLRCKAKNGLHLASMVYCTSLQTWVLGILVRIFDLIVQDFDKAIAENTTFLERTFPQCLQG